MLSNTCYTDLRKLALVILAGGIVAVGACSNSSQGSSQGVIYNPVPPG